MRISKVIDGVYRISLAWSNVYLLWDGVVGWLIDSGLESDRQDLRSALRELHVEPSTIKAIVQTHAHCDHAGSAAYFQVEFGTELYCHEAEARHLCEPKFSYGPHGTSALRHPFQALIYRSGEKIFPVERSERCLAVQDDDVLHSPIGPLRVYHSPGHTAGHIALLRESDRLLFCGDAILTIVPNLIPALRKPGLSLPLRLFTPDWPMAIRSAAALAELKPTLLASGHGWPMTENTAATLSAWAART